MKNQKVLFIPVETKVRELHAKILLSCYAANDGFSVVLGMQSELLRKVKYLGRGIYVEKGVSPPKIPGTRLLKEMGNKIVAWCEEGLVIVDQESYARDRVSSVVYTMLDLFFAWGKVQGGAIEQKMKEQSAKTVIAGNPRFDLLREPYQVIFKKEAEQYKKDHGPFILVNTNFGLYNNFFGPDYFIEKLMRAHGRIKGDEHEAFLQDWVAHVGKVFEKFKEIMPLLSKAFPEHKIVLRPHPSENHDAWRDAVKGLGNVEVIHKGNVIPWILASDVLIHNSCTTGVESHVMGKPVVAYRPVLSHVYEYELPRVVSVPAFTPEETVEVIRDILAGEDVQAPEAALSKDYAVNVDGPFACETIVSSLTELLEQAPFEPVSPISVLAARIRWKIKDALYDTKVAINKALNRKQSDAAYMKQKISGITIEEVRQVIEDFRSANDDFTGLKVEKVPGARYCFRITRDDQRLAGRG